ncbi:UDP-glycosyltransferase 708G1-like isoform X2 [Prosopis cineraria]|uniref:UDP-glycosyltransferase 708G1-like isoform X2 n=1 Tax=Prosopis cineraria TaxID=364024 RepID=UPI00240FABD0|nr:UDP-glycosyltransferase 708G1-like isoform X2 [Prosopis cineraria]XP_054810276.1 UDP-glycosyltransferase 708G1-like isoform X2 [Prosopis cineraria]
MSLENMSNAAVHVALFPNAGMGHLTPFLRLAALLVDRHCRVTVISPQPTVSMAESKHLSRFHSAFPQFEAIRRSCCLLPSLLASASPPLSAFVCDVTLISPVLPITESLRLPIFILFTSSARMLSLFSSVSRFIPSISEMDSVEIPGVSTIPRSCIPPLLLLPNNVFAKILLEDGPKLPKSCGILVNSFEALELNPLESLNSGKVVKELPPVFPIGPFVPCEFEKSENEEQRNSSPLKWLNDQSPGSVVYVSFGSRLGMAREQVREIGNGLMKSGFKFLWVVKDKKVDREEEDDVEKVIGVELMKRLKSNGLVVNEWVDQSDILSHSSVGGFVSHCGWNSVMEAAWHGVPILGWPQIGDQKLNAEVVEKTGWGIWRKTWGWAGENVVRGEEIGDAIDEMMKNEGLKMKAEKVKETARKAVDGGGSSEISVQRLIGEWKKMNDSC